MSCGRVRGDKIVFDFDGRSPQSIRHAGFKLGTGEFTSDAYRVLSNTDVLFAGPSYGSVILPMFEKTSAFWFYFKFRPLVAKTANNGVLFDTWQYYLGPSIERGSDGKIYVWPAGVSGSFSLTDDQWTIGKVAEVFAYFNPAAGLKIYWNGVLALSVNTTWSGSTPSNLAITIGTDINAGHFFSMDLIRAFAGTGTLTADEIADLASQDETEELRPEQSLIWLPMRRQYGAGTANDPKRTPNLGSLGAACDAYLGDNGQGGTDEPTILSPHGYSFDGGDYLTVPNNAGLTFGDGAGTDYPFSVVMMLSGLNTGAAPGYIGRAGKAILYGDLNLYNSTHIVVALSDYRQNGAYISSYANGWARDSGLDKGTPVSYIVTYDASKTSAGFKHYYDGVYHAGTPGTSGSYAGCGDNATDLMIARCAPVYLNGKMHEVAIFPFELTPRQVSILSAQMKARVNV